MIITTARGSRAPPTSWIVPFHVIFGAPNVTNRLVLPHDVPEGPVRDDPLEQRGKD